MVANQAEYFGGGMLGWRSSLLTGNSVFWDNFAESGWQFALGGDSHLTVTYCDIQGDNEGLYRESGTSVTWENNINRYPRFVDRGYGYDSAPGLGDYRLRDISLCLDAGNNTAIAGYNQDVEGEARLYGAGVDMGAYEYHDSRSALDVTILTINKFKVTARNDGYGTVKCSGELNAHPQITKADQEFYVRVGPYQRTIDFELDSVKQKRSGRYIGIGKSASGGKTKLVIDPKKGTFSLTARNVYLLGLTEPVEVEITLGESYRGLGQATSK